MKLSGKYLTEDQIDERVKSFEYVSLKGKQIGIVVLDQQDQIGWSLYNDDKEDEPASRDKGLLIALSRAEKGDDWVYRDLLSKREEAIESNRIPNRLNLVLFVIEKMKMRRELLRG